MALDLLIDGGHVIDGTGNPGYRAGVGVQGDKVRILRGNLSDVVANQVIDGTGLVVSPGFIDLHSHSGLTILEDPRHEIKVRQGVTSELVGVDGISYAPLANDRLLAELVRYHAGLDGKPDLTYSWTTVAQYLKRFDGNTSINVGMVVGNSALRLSVIGWGDEAATDRDLANMKALLREGMEEGALGLSTGLDYPPGSHATTAELVELSEVAGALGGIYHTHMRYQLGDRFLDPLREAIEIGRRSGASLHVTHLYRRAVAPGGSQDLLDLVREANEEGTETTFDTYPFGWSSTTLLMLIPMPLQTGGPDALIEKLSNPSARTEIRAAIERRAGYYGGSHVWSRIHLGYFANPQNQQYEGVSIADVAASRDQHPADTVCDLLVDEDLRVNQVAAGPDEISVAAFLTDPVSMVGSDSVFVGARPSPRTYGTFPRVLGQFVRDERQLSLPEAIRKMTSFPAQTLGLQDRGILRDGMKADIVVFDANRIRSNATYEDPRRMAEGVHHVVVNGKLVLHDGQMTDALPGRSLGS
jgi:N-acyl-D-amino-acid deacylase